MLSPLYYMSWSDHARFRETTKLRSPFIIMTIQYDPHFYAIWQKLCSAFSTRITILSRLRKLIPILLNWRHDQITWHRQLDPAWNDATETIRSLSTPTLQSLCQLADENLGLHKNRLIFTSSVFAATWTLAVFLFGFGIQLVGHLVTASEFRMAWESAFDVWLGVGIGFVGYLVLVAFAWDATQQAYKLRSCIRVALISRHASVNHGHEQSAPSELIRPVCTDNEKTGSGCAYFAALGALLTNDCASYPCG